jgi:transaldolase
MRLFIDSSDPDLWRRYRQIGWAYGATTNPLILKRDGRKCSIKTYRLLVEAAKDVGLQELQIQATGSTAEELTRTGEEIAALWPHIVVKVPLTQAGLEAATSLIGQTVRITMTAAYATHQMIAASAMGADYIAPYYGRLKEAGKDADGILQAMLAMRKDANTPRILVASIRSITQLEILAANGHDTFTLSPEVAEQLAINTMSDNAAADFEKACLT